MNPEQTYAGRPLKEFVHFDPYLDECEVRCRQVVIRRARKPHHCFYPVNTEGHEIAAGSMVRHEKAIVEGTWQRYYTCLDCIEGWLKFTDGPPPDVDPDEWSDQQEGRGVYCPICKPRVKERAA